MEDEDAIIARLTYRDRAFCPPPLIVVDLLNPRGTDAVAVAARDRGYIDFGRVRIEDGSDATDLEWHADPDTNEIIVRAPGDCQSPYEMIGHLAVGTFIRIYQADWGDPEH